MSIIKSFKPVVPWPIVPVMPSLPLVESVPILAVVPVKVTDASTT